MIVGKIYSICTKSNVPQLKMFHSVVKPGCRLYEEHRHTALELSYIYGGSGTYRTGKATYPFQAGDIFLFNSNEPHCIVNISTELHIMNLHFEPRFIWSPENILLQVQYPDIFFRRNERYSHRLSVKPTSAKKIACKMQIIEQEFQQEEMDYRLMVKLQILELLVLIRREYMDCFENTTSHMHPFYLMQMEKALDYIDQNLAEELKLEMVAKEVAMSPAYFSTLFKRLNGFTLWEYVQSKRIEIAAEKLLMTDHNISDIATECGYNSISNFNRCFKMIMGQSPGNYRKNCTHEYTTCNVSLDC